MNPTVLLVLDDTAYRDRLTDALKQFNCQVLPVRSAHSALIVLRQFPGIIDLLITAPELTGMSGDQLSRVALREREHLRSIILRESMDDLLHEVRASLDPAQLQN